MASFLFLTWNGGGTTVPVLAIASELLRRGHSVRVLGHGPQAAQFAREGIPFAAYPRAGSFAVTASPLNLFALVRDPRAARDVGEELDARPVDLVVADPLLLSTLKTLHERDQRFALLESTLDTLMRPRLRRLGRVLWIIGLPAQKLLSGAAAVVVASVAELDVGAGEDVEHVGPMLRAVASRATHPKILVSLSTFPFPHLAKTWQRLLNAVSELPVQVVATTGPALDPAELNAPANVDLKTWADHAELMPEVTAVVTHGGHGTTIAALAHGVPVLVIPLDTSSDQPGIGRAVEHAGVGIAVSRNASTSQLKAALHQLVGDEDLKRKANELGKQIRRYGGSQAGAEALIRVAELATREGLTCIG